MTFSDWLESTSRRFRERPMGQAAARSVHELALGGMRRVDRAFPTGECYWDRDWEVLIILDACRYDLFEEVSREYGWIPEEISAVRSPASHSDDWMGYHFSEEYADEKASAALVCANVFTEQTTAADEWAYLDELWRTGWDTQAGVVRAETVVDAAIDAWRNERESAGINRMIVWFLQPHVPFVPVEWSNGYGDVAEFGYESVDYRGEGSPWDRYREGKLTREELWSAYRANLRYALDNVARLRENVETGRMVITSDHGNGMGEWGIYGHPKGMMTDALRRGPWVEIEATDTKSHMPEAVTGGESTRVERLRSLGYL